MRRALDVGVTVDARHAQLAGMKLMRKRHRLFRGITDTCELGPERTPGCRPEQAGGQHGDDDDLAKQSIRTRLKDHVYPNVAEILVPSCGPLVMEWVCVPSSSDWAATFDARSPAAARPRSEAASLSRLILTTPGRTLPDGNGRARL
jgi:hypothetical protein